MSQMPNIRFVFGGSLIVLWIVLFVGAVVVARFFYRRTNPPVEGSTRGLLLGLRIASLAVLALLLTEPLVVLAYRTVRKPVLAVLIDRSESMEIVDAKGSRRDTLDSLLGDPMWATLAEQAALRRFEFAEDARAVTDPPSEGAELAGMGTDLAKALRFAADALKEDHLAGLVLLSDGGGNLGEDPVRLAQALPFPVYAVGIGDTEPQRDIKIVEVVAKTLGYAGEQMEVEVAVAGWGYADVRVPITVSEDGKVLAAGQLQFAGQGNAGPGGEQRLTLQIAPQHPGLHRYEVAVAQQRGELSADNNQQVLFIKVLKSRTKVLILAGKPSADFSFLRRSLGRDKNIEADVRVARDNNRFYEGTFPASLGGYDLVVLLDMPRQLLRGRPEHDLAQFVKDGKAALVLGGPQALGAEYRDSPLADALPVTVSSEPSSHRTGSYPLALTREGQVHVTTRIVEDPSENARLWEALPPLLAVNDNLGAKAGCTVLATSPTFRHGDLEVPLIAVGRYGRGKVMVGALSSFWRMDLMMWGIRETNQVSDTFWGNTVRWLVTEEDASPVRVSADKRAYRGGERVHFEGEVYDERNTPQQHAEVTLTLTGQGAGRDVSMEEVGKGRYRAEVSGLPPGDYTYTARAAVQGRDVGEAEGQFSVSRYSLEFGDTRMNEALLSRIAHESGGAFYPAQEAHRLLGDLKLDSSAVEVKREVPLWSSPWLVGLLTLSLAAEWAIRKRRGMV